jgi:DNA-directed RNA polymerase specialized sigma24 family protein
MSDKRAQINHAKSELRNYMYLLNVCHGYESKIVGLQTHLEAIKSPSAPMTQGSSGITPEERQSELRDKLQRCQRELSFVRYRTDKVKVFLDGLDHNDRVIVTDVYIKNINIEKVATRFYCSEKTMKRRIDDIMLKY